MPGIRESFAANFGEVTDTHGARGFVSEGALRACLRLRGRREMTAAPEAALLGGLAAAVMVRTGKIEQGHLLGERNNVIHNHSGQAG